ncbi:MAG TPA: hypothetical protein VMR46_00525 [Candidatus Paceibacterota bacterium]|nr:hypothetical protein [Candidatus Paceibacterota bacterium]
MGDFLNKWQTLIGAGLGPFLAVILSAIGFSIKSKLEKNAEIRETMRRIEVGSTAALNDIYFTRAQLRDFAKKIRALSAETRAETRPNAFALDRINCPAFLDVYRDPDIHTLKIRSYYLHNQSLFSDSRIKEMNRILSQLKPDFEDMLRGNETLVALMQSGPNPDPPTQRLAYAQNLEAFADGIEAYANKKMSEPIKALTRIKIYNDRLRKRHWRGYYMWWKMESPSFKFFMPKAERAKLRTLDSFERIEKIIDSEVEKALKDAEQRSATEY